MGILGAGYLLEKLAVVCPVVRVEVADRNSKGGWIVSISPTATTEQRAAAQAILDAFDPAAAQAEIASEEQAESARQAKARALFDWLRTQTKDVREHFAELKAENATLRSDLEALTDKVTALEAKLK